MVKRLLRTLAAAALVLPLTACIFVLSPFPSTLSQVVAKADVSSVVPAANAGNYQPCVLTPTGGEFVVLMNRTMGMDPVAVILDSNLNLIQTYTNTQASGWSAGWTGGSVAMTDAAGRAAIGSVWFSAYYLGYVGAPPSGNLGSARLYAPSFPSPNAQTDDVNFNFTAGSISYQQYDWMWSSLIFTRIVQVDTAGNSYQVQAVYNVDDTPSAGAVVMVLTEPTNSSHVTFVRIPLADLTGIPTASLKNPLLSYYTWKSYDSVPSSSIGFAGDCMVGYDQSSRTLNRYSLSTFDVIQSLPIGNSDYRLQYAYQPAGKYAVIYDPSARTITKVARWW